MGCDVKGDLSADLNVQVGSGFRVDAVINVPAGHTTALLGPNGAGKSTIVAALAGLQPLTNGSVKLGDRVLDEPSSGTFVRPEHRRIGIVFQNALLFPHLTVIQNVEFGPRSLRRDPGLTKDVVARWMERLELGPIADRRPGQLSGGEMQRVAIARALATEPDLLILDEPLASIDASARSQIRRLLVDFLAAFDGPAIVITHDPTEAFLLTQSVIIVENGSVTDAGPGDAVRLRPRSTYAADLAGVNFVKGKAIHGRVVSGSHEIYIADSSLAGEVVATIHPRSIALHARRPEGSARNVWSAMVDRIEENGEKVRVLLGAPMNLTAEVTSSGARDVGVEVGEPVWVSIKATEIDVVSVAEDEDGFG